MEKLLSFVFKPLNLAMINFVAFAGILALGAISNNVFLMFASFGFMIAGANISVLHYVGAWLENQEEPAQTTGAVKDAMPKNNTKIQALLE